MTSLVPRPLPDLFCSRGEPIFLEGGEIKSGSGLGTRHFEESHLQVVKMQTSHYQSGHSCRSGLGPITFQHAQVL